MPATLVSRLVARPDLPLRLAGRAATLAVAAAGCWLLADLAWGLLPPTPAPAVAVERRPVAVTETFAQRLQFAGGATAAATPGNLLLVGTAASGDPAQARALLRREGDSRLLVAAVGDEIMPGLRLQRVERGQVILAGSAGEQRLSLPQAAQPKPDPHPDD